MAVTMTYTSLAADVQSYLERTDAATIDKIPTFIMLAEQILAAEIKFLGNLTVDTSTLTASDPVVAKPARWRKTVSINVTVAGERRPVLERRYEYIRNYWPDPTETDVPLFYADYDYTHWFLGPTPAAAYAFEVLYYERPVPLDSTNQTNWFTEYAPQAMLYGSLLQAMPFLKNDPRIQTWQSMYDKYVAELRTEDKLRIADRQAVAVDT